jgi:hypothetical protein
MSWEEHQYRGQWKTDILQNDENVRLCSIILQHHRPLYGLHFSHRSTAAFSSRPQMQWKLLHSISSRTNDLRNDSLSQSITASEMSGNATATAERLRSEYKCTLKANGQQRHVHHTRRSKRNGRQPCEFRAKRCQVTADSALQRMNNTSLASSPTVGLQVVVSFAVIMRV